MAEKHLGKITFAEYGIVPDRPFLIGLQLEFEFDNGRFVSNGTGCTVNISPDCKWETRTREEAVTEDCEYFDYEK